MSRSLRLATVAAVAAAGALALSACGGTDKTPTGGNVAAPTAAASSAATTPGDAAQPTPSTADSASALPDICKLLTKAEVTDLTGEQVTIMTDEGGNSPNARYCQWQLSAGQLTVTVNNEDRQSFDVRNQQSKSVDGIGETAYSLAGHLYVYDAGRTVDVYVSSEGSASANLTVEKKTATQVLPRLKG
jgi:hypothetical protein